MRMKRLLPIAALITVTFLTLQMPAQDAPPGRILRGSLVEDKAARKLIDAGDARFESDEAKKAVEIWQSIIERYPRSRVRYEAHMRLGNYFLDKERAHDRARAQFEAVAAEDNRDEDQRAAATLKIGSCFYHARNFGKCFQVMRDVIQKFPVSQHVNEAYYYIGLGHFQLGHYSRAIAALEKVGTTVSGDDSQIEKVEAGKRLFVKIEDADLAVLEPGEAVDVQVQVTGGDAETIKCYPVGRNVRIVLGSIPTRLGTPKPGNDSLEVKGDDTVKVTYIDRHTADRKFDQEVTYDVVVVGDGIVSITDGAFSESLGGVVLGKSVNVQIADADRDLSSEADSIKAVVEVLRRKTDEELEAEAADAAQAPTENAPADSDDDGEPKIDKFKLIDRVEVTLTEARIVRELASADSQLPAATDDAGTDAKPTENEKGGDPAKPVGQPKETEKEPADDSIHSGIFRVIVPLAKTETVVEGDAILQAISSDVIRVTYLDDRHSGEGIAQLKAEARAIEGDLSGVRVTRAEISDRELKIKTSLKSANALTNIGNRYKEFGLKANADVKYKQALGICEETMKEARSLGGRLLEETYVQLWQVYFEMDRLELAAAMAQRLQQEFPNSGFVDDALLQLADVARKQGNLRRAIGIYTRLARIEKSQLRGEAQFGIAQCYEQMAEAAPEASASQLYDRAFLEYQKVYEQFPDSGRVGEAVAKMANYYYRQKDYGRAIDTFETVLANHPDAKFLDVILFNYGRCLYRMKRRPEARRRFDQLIGDYPESPLAADAKKISDALAAAGG
jgi:tetratricopeptide (TPR) repeat protein